MPTAAGSATTRSAATGVAARTVAATGAPLAVTVAESLAGSAGFILFSGRCKAAAFRGAGRAGGASASACWLVSIVEGATCTAVADPAGPAGGGSTKASGGGGTKVLVCTPSDPPAFPVSEAAASCSGSGVCLAGAGAGAGVWDMTHQIIVCYMYVVAQTRRRESPGATAQAGGVSIATC